MTAPPSGTVTFLFTDIEGSTQRWEHHRAAMAPALDRHNALIEAAIARHGGFVFHTAGDAFCAAFASASAALVSAIDAQRSLAAEDWTACGPDFAPLLVRMGIHTGTVELREGDYFGPPLNRTARLMAAGHGGQILISLATQQLVRDDLPPGAVLRDFGAHRLKDLRHAEHLFQLLVPGLPDITTAPATAERLSERDVEHLDEELRPAACPYRGLFAFREADAPFFFGREAFTERLRAAALAKPMVGVIGPSGSGKSSVVFAGLVPELRGGQANGQARFGGAESGGVASGGLVTSGVASGGATSGGTASRAAGGLTGAGGWEVIELRPGADPFRALAAVLAPALTAELGETDRLIEVKKLTVALRDGTLSVGEVVERIAQKSPSYARLFFIADQFEELYTLCRADREQRRFQDVLFEMVHDGGHHGRGGSAVKLALTLRADFMGHALAYRPFADAIQDHNVVLGPMTTEEITRAIVKPAELQGRAFERGLVDRILGDIGEDAGSLPLLEFALTRLWEQQRGGWLTHEAYESIGRVEGAVARHADAVFDGLVEHEQVRVRRVFVQLVRPGEGTEDTRRLATREELPDDWPLVHRLADARLVVTNRDGAGHETAEVVHEALIRGWGRLVGWMGADRAFRVWQERLRVAQKQWEATQRDEGALLRGLPLSEAEQWLGERGDALSSGERAFVEAGLAGRRAREAAEVTRVARERAMERRGRNRLRALVAVLSAGILLTLGLSAVALSARRASDASAREARRSATIARSRELLAKGQGDLALALALEAVADGQAPPAAELALSEAAYAAGTRRLITDPMLAYLAHVAISPDGRKLLSAGEKGASLWDMETGRRHQHLAGHNEYVNSVAFSPDGSLAISSSDDAIGKTPDRAVIVWDVATGRRVQTFGGHTNYVMSAAISPDNRRALSGSTDGTVRLWDIATGKEIRRFSLDTEGIRRIAFLPDGKRAVAHVRDTAAVVWDLETGKEILRFVALDPVTGKPFSATDLAFDSDSRHIGVSFGLGGGRVWDVDSGAEIGTLKASFWFIALAGGARHLLTSLDNALTLWDVAQGTPIQYYVGHTEEVAAIAATRDGLAAASASMDDEGIRIWNLWSSALTRTMTGHADLVGSVAISHDGKRVLSGSRDRTARLWDIQTGREIQRFEGHAEGVSEVAFSPDNQTIVTGSSDGTAVLWDTASGRPLHRLRHGYDVASAEFSADGRWILTASSDGMTRLWDATSGTERRRFSSTGTVRERAFKLFPRPLGYHLARDSIFGFQDRAMLSAVSNQSIKDHTVVQWDAKGNLVRHFSGHITYINAMALSRDGRTLFSAATDRTVRWWDVATGQEVHRTEFDAAVYDIALSPDGGALLVATTGRDMFLLDIARREIIRRYDIGAGREVNSVAFSPDGRSAVSGSADGVVRVWPIHRTLGELLAWIPTRRYVPELTCDERNRLATERQCGPDGTAPQSVLEIIGHGTGANTGAAFTAAPAALSSASAASRQGDISAGPSPSFAPLALPTAEDEAAPAREVRRVELPAGTFPYRHFIYSVAVSPDGRRALLGTWHGVRMVDLETGADAWRAEREDRSDVLAVALAPDVRTAVSGNYFSNQLIAWDVATGQARQTISAGASVYSLAVSPDGRRAAFGTVASLGLWTLGQPEAELLGEGIDAVTALAFSPDGRTLLTGGPDGRPRLWDVAAEGPPKALRVFGGEKPEHTDFIRTVAFSPDGRTALSGDVGALVWWDVASGTATHRVTDHQGVYFAQFSPDGRHLLTSTEDAVIRVWDAATRQVVRVLRGHTGVRIPAVFTAGGCRVVSAGDDGVVIEWDLGLCEGGEQPEP